MPRRSYRPRSRAVCTSSSSTDGRNVPLRTSSASASKVFWIRSCSWSSSSSARCKTRACAFDANRSYGASRQSNCTLTDSRASASAGPPLNRPPHNRSGGVPSPGLRSSVSAIGPFYRPVALGRDPARQTPPLDEALGQRLVEGVVCVIGREVVVVEGAGTPPSGDDRAATVKDDAHLPRHVPRRVVDERVERVLER